MPFVLIPLAALLGYCLFCKKGNRHMTPAYDRVYQKALASTNPEGIAKAASVFGAEGFGAEAQVLKNRAKVPSLSWSTHNQRTAIFRNALESQNPQEVQSVAKAFSQAGLQSTATFLMQHAEGLERALGLRPILVSSLVSHAAPTVENPPGELEGSGDLDHEPPGEPAPGEDE
jgi:hypothetical protein